MVSIFTSHWEKFMYRVGQEPNIWKQYQQHKALNRQVYSCAMLLTHALSLSRFISFTVALYTRKFNGPKTSLA